MLITVELNKVKSQYNYKDPFYLFDCLENYYYIKSSKANMIKNLKLKNNGYLTDLCDGLVFTILANICRMLERQ